MKSGSSCCSSQVLILTLPAHQVDVPWGYGWDLTGSHGISSPWELLTFTELRSRCICMVSASTWLLGFSVALWLIMYCPIRVPRGVCFLLSLLCSCVVHADCIFPLRARSVIGMVSSANDFHQTRFRVRKFSCKTTTNGASLWRFLQTRLRGIILKISASAPRVL